MIHSTHACPSCKTAENVVRNGGRTLKSAGRVQRFVCRTCSRSWSVRTGTVLDGLRTAPERIASAIHARSEGVGLRATARLCGITPGTVQRWEQRLADREAGEDPLPARSDFVPVIELDELYTKVHHNRPADDSPGWTLIALERATRYWVAVATGERKEALFDSGVSQAWRIAGNRPSQWFSDGETSYEAALWPLARYWHTSETLATPMRRGRRPGSSFRWREGILLARKVKSSQGQARQRYERTRKLHATTPDCEDYDIHAYHVEAFNGSLRRRCSPFRRRTNTYAKSEAGLRRALGVQRRIYNHCRPHPGLPKGTTPAMAAGVATRALSLVELLAR
jgi:transposase-like protein